MLGAIQAFHDQQVEYLLTPVERLGFGSQQTQALEQAGIERAYQLIVALQGPGTRRLKIPGFGANSIRIFKALLENKDISLDEELSENLLEILDHMVNGEIQEAKAVFDAVVYSQRVEMDEAEGQAFDLLREK